MCEPCKDMAFMGEETWIGRFGDKLDRCQAVMAAIFAMREVDPAHAADTNQRLDAPGTHQTADARILSKAHSTTCGT
ncbi:MAG: hypothetical protein IPK97_17310 [Ahniella sp.]|nr:hypothetical protein [Ahniella sp.]